MHGTAWHRTLPHSISTIACLVLSSVFSTQAQQAKPTAHIAIQVNDVSGSFVANVHVEILGSNFAKNWDTDGTGKLSVDLPFGGYDLTATETGFKPAKKRIDVLDTTDRAVTLVLDLAKSGPVAPVTGVSIAELSHANLPDQLQDESNIPLLDRNIDVYSFCLPCPGVPQPATQLKLDAGPFSILAPLGWEFHQLMGVDSFVGEFVGDGVVLRFDFGQHSGGNLKKYKKPDYVFDHESIGGFPAKIASSKTPGQGLTGVYFRNVGHSNGLFLWGQDLTPAQQELALKIFKTIRFGGAVPRYVIPPPPPKNAQ
jgi:hypothetical protein